ncbi:MAG TPA: four helix bundle protein [Chitinophagaceae bacterium]|nr:four helix bundle protein [Chitinophagaceae bacterium]
MPENNHFGFEELELWKKVREFKKEVIKEARGFPVEEKFRLTDQIIRSSRSVNALISEGHGRFTYPDQIHYCIQARGSLTETINHLIDAFDDGYITEVKLFYFKAKGKEVERLLNGYLSFLRKKRDEQKKKGNTDL